MHHIQRKIISKLMYAPTLGYAQMRPASVESNHFAYHLEQLVKTGYIAKQDRNYFLTSKGKSLADRVSHNKVEVRSQPHIVTSIYITNDMGKNVLFKHAFQPYLHLYGMPQGRLHYEETVMEAANRELEEKTGLTGINLVHRGIAYIQATTNEVTLSKLLSHVFSGSIIGEPSLSTATKKGQAFWMDASTLSSDQYMPGFEAIKALVDTSSNELFFAEITSTLR